MSHIQEKLIIDTDPGIDDAFALCYAMAHPNISILALTTIFGNVDIQLATDNAARLCQLTHTNAIIATGARVPLSIAPNPHSYFVHGDNGFGNISLPLAAYSTCEFDAADTIAHNIVTNPGQITLVAVGPLTNLAVALQRHPTITEHVKSVVVMGGAFDRHGNVTPYAEANSWNDPHAAQAVLKADWPLTILGLDVTHQVSFTREFFDQLAELSPDIGGCLHNCAEYYIDFYEQQSNFSGCCPHDQVALTFVTHPEWFECDTATIDVITSGKQIGRTFRTTDGSSRKKLIGLKVDVDKLKQDYLNILAAQHG